MINQFLGLLSPTTTALKHKLKGRSWIIKKPFQAKRTKRESNRRWYLLTNECVPQGQNLWDVCHELKEVIPDGYFEPDLPQRWLWNNSLVPSDACTPRDWMCAPRPEYFDEHLDKTQLRTARSLIGDPTGRRVRIVHIDTGYDPCHAARPKCISSERNFVWGEPENNASDNPLYEPIGFLDFGHGTFTIGILAGGSLENATPTNVSKNENLGGAPYCDIVPVRIAESVILLTSSAFAQAIEYAISLGQMNAAERCDVITISMGGLPGLWWADTVNCAYESGICIVAAAGNNFGGFPYEQIVWPARFERVIAACGVMFNGKPYQLELPQMQGNFGPSCKQATTLAAYTPNIPALKFGCNETTVDLDGQGTSAATPQIAAAAALWLQRYQGCAEFAGEPWKRVEAVRHALFTSAAPGDFPGWEQFFGRGIVQAANALAICPTDNLVMADRASPTLPFTDEAILTAEKDTDRAKMYGVELAQMLYLSKALRDSFGDIESTAPIATVQDFFYASAQDHRCSEELRRFLMSYLNKRAS